MHSDGACDIHSVADFIAGGFPLEHGHRHGRLAFANFGHGRACFFRGGGNSTWYPQGIPSADDDRNLLHHLLWRGYFTRCEHLNVYKIELHVVYFRTLLTEREAQASVCYFFCGAYNLASGGNGRLVNSKCS